MAVCVPFFEESLPQTDGHKKSLGACARQTFNSLLSLIGRPNYSATAAESVAVLSATTAALSLAAATSSVAGAAVSVASALAALLPPQDAKDTATMATAIKTNFFIFFCFLKRNTINCFIKTSQRYGLFGYVVSQTAIFFMNFCGLCLFTVFSSLDCNSFGVEKRSGAAAELIIMRTFAEYLTDNYDRYNYFSG